MGKVKIGIVADNYKLSKFKRELKEKGLDNFTIHPFKDETSTIKVTTDSINVGIIKTVCEKVEAYFKSQKN